MSRRPGAAGGAAAAFDVPVLTTACVTALVNEWGTVPQRVSPRPWDGYPGPASPERRRLAAEWGEAPAPADATVVAAADAVYPVFAAADPADRARGLDQLLGRLRVVPRLAPGDEGLVLRWAVPAAPDRLAGAMGVALVRALTGERRERLGTCAAHDCADVFADGSPGRSRAYCSTRCQTRQRVRAHRAHRARGAGG